jgi:hypothetical protein
VTQRDRIMLGVIALVAVLAGSWMLAIKPKREEAGRLAEQASAAQERLDAATAALASAKQARAAYADAQKTVARVGKAVPADDDVATLVFQLERSARRAGIDFRSIDLAEGGGSPTPAGGPGTGAPAGGVTPVPFRMTFEGDFFDLRRFLSLVRSNAKIEGTKIDVRGRLLSVDGVSLVASRKGFPNIKAQIAASAYTAPVPTAAAAGAADGAAATGGTAPATPDASAAPASATPAAVTGVAR